MRALALAVLAASACATTGDAVAPAPSPFRGVRSVLLVRSAEERGRRARDPLDGLDETLRARGFTTRIVDVGARGTDQAAAERLFGQLHERASARFAERAARPVSTLAEAGALVTQLGVDAVATYHRVDRVRTPSIGEPAPMIPGSTLSPPPGASAGRAIAAFVVADRAGHVQTFAWGGGGPIDDPATPVNPAEAIELVARALTGEPPEE
jgi:hypothetical protein